MKPVQPLRRSTLAACAVVLALLSYLVIDRFYGSLPGLSWISAGTIALVAVIEAVMARATGRRITGGTGARPIHPLTVVRILALAQATAIVGTLLTGFYTGFFVYTLTMRGQLAAASTDLFPSGGAAGASILLVIAALWLENSCRAPEPPEDGIGSAV